MGRSLRKRDTSRERILSAAGQAFRRHGLGGIGVDGLAKGAGLTSGAFYFHFSSKLDAFTRAVEAGLEELRAGVATLQAREGAGWLAAFAAFYMGTKRTCDLREGCTLPALSSEVERAGDEARLAYESRLRALAETVEKGLAANPSATAREEAWMLLALLSGGVNMARAVKDEALSAEIAAAIEKAATRFRTAREPSSSDLS